ncbi:MAG: RNA methyltransferase [Bacteroidota bacterium]
MLNQKIKNSDLNRKTIEENLNAIKLNITVILDNVRSAQNVGSIFRTSDAFHVDKIYLCGITATPPNKEIFKTALGATESVKWEHYENINSLVETLKSEQYTVISIEQTANAQMLHEVSFQLNEKYAFVFGNEVDGVSQTVIDNSHGVIEIPQFGSKHSLNISVSAGVILWEAAKQLAVNHQ